MPVKDGYHCCRKSQCMGEDHHEVGCVHNLYKITANRETDALIAEHVMGYRRVTIGPDANGKHGGTEVLIPPTISERESWDYLPKAGPVPIWYFAPLWSTQLLGAMNLWNKLAAQGWTCTLAHRQFEKHEDDRWIFHGVLLITPEPPDINTQRIKSFSAHAGTRELAIARGALNSVRDTRQAQ
jgi:hypothetical protein